MNAPEPLIVLQNAEASANPADRKADDGRIAALDKFALEEFQNLTKEDLLLAQAIAGHGDEWGVWKTPKDICESRLQEFNRTIDFAWQMRKQLAKTPLPDSQSELIAELVQEGTLVLTRIALLMRLAPSGGKIKSKSQRMKPSSMSVCLYQYYPSIIARAIQRKAVYPDSPGLLGCLAEDDLLELRKNKRHRVELDRLGTLAARGWWTDLPPLPDVTQTTDPSGPKPIPVPQDVPGEFQHIDNLYLEKFGPHNLWLIRELGPRLLPLLEDLATHLEDLDFSNIFKHVLRNVVRNFIAQHLKDHPWLDGMGRPLKPNFPLKTGAKSKDKFQFPPRKWAQLKVLSVTLQSAHLFLTLLASAGRIGEVDTLPRSCVTTARDGKDYVKGWTYKLSGNLFGDAKQFPAPPVLVQTLGQQVRLAEVWLRLPPKNLADGLLKEQPLHNALWLSLGASANSNAAEPLLNPVDALMKLAERIGMDPKPGGINLHPHRLRKTIGRLAGIALFNSPTALKRLFGHKCIEMTLRYILCDKDIQTEAEAVLRELRIMHCAETLEEVRDAIALGTPLPAHSGAAASRMADAVKEHEVHLTASGRVWKEGSAYDLAYLLTARGKGWRFMQKNIICAKAPGEAGLCMKNRGEPNTSNCKPECDNRIVLALARRDADEIVGAYMQICLQALEEEQFDTFYYSMEQIFKELDNFPDIKERYLAEPQMQSLLAVYKDLD